MLVEKEKNTTDQVPKLKDILHAKKIPVRYILALIFMAMLIIGAIIANLVIL